MIDINRVQSVYSGKAGKCCCGCSGKHFTASKFVAQNEARRGYAVDPKDISDRMVSLVVNILNKAEKVEDDGDNVSVEVGNRVYIAYYAEAA